MKSSATSTKHRAVEVARMAATGHRRADVVHHCSDGWGLAPRTADRLIALARLQLRSDWDFERPQLIADQLSQLSALQQEARAEGNYACALVCINAAARLAGLF